MNERVIFRYLLYFISGIILGVIAIQVCAQETKYYFAFVGATALSAPLAYIFLIISTQTKTRLICLFTATFTLGIAFHLHLTYFYRSYVGVCSVDVSVSLLSLLVVFGFFVYDAKLSYQEYFSFHINGKIVSAFLLYMAAGCMSMISADFLDLSVLELVRLLTLLFMMFVIMNLQDRKYIDVLLLCLSIDLVLESCIALYQFKTGKMLGLRFFGEKEIIIQNIGMLTKRATGTIGDPNIFGYFFEMLIPLMFAMFIAERRFFIKIWYFFATCIGCVGIYTTLSRGAWMTLPLSTTLVFLIMFRGRFLRLSTFIWVWFAALVFSVILFMSFPVVYARFTHDDYGSAAARGPLNEAAFSVVRQFPVFGVGLNNMAKVFKKYDTTGHSRMFVGSEHVVHNMYLQIWTEVGTVGLAAFLYMLIVVVSTGSYILYRVNYWDRGIVAGLTAGILAQGMHAMVDIGFKTMMNMSMLFYTYIALIAALSIIHREEVAAGIVPK